MSGARYLQYAIKPQSFFTDSRILALAVLSLEPTLAGKGFSFSFKNGDSAQLQGLKKETRKCEKLVASFKKIVDDADRVAEASLDYDRFIAPTMRLIKANFIKSVLDAAGGYSADKPFPLPHERDMKKITDHICQICPDQDPCEINDIVEKKIQCIGIKEWKRQFKAHVEAGRILIRDYKNVGKVNKLFAKLDQKRKTDYWRHHIIQCDLSRRQDKIFHLCMDQLHLVPFDLFESQTAFQQKLEEVVKLSRANINVAPFDETRLDLLEGDLMHYLGESASEVRLSVILSCSRMAALRDLRDVKQYRSQYASTIRKLSYFLIKSMRTMSATRHEYDLSQLRKDLSCVQNTIQVLKKSAEVRIMADAIEESQLADLKRFWRRKVKAPEPDMSESCACRFALYNVCLAMLATAAEEQGSKTVAETLLQVLQQLDQSVRFPKAQVSALKKIVQGMQDGSADSESVQGTESIGSRETSGGEELQSDDVNETLNERLRSCQTFESPTNENGSSRQLSLRPLSLIVEWD